MGLSKGRRMPIHVVEHPLARHLLVLLRDRRTQPDAFRQYSMRLTTLLAFEATHGLETTEVRVETPLCETTGQILRRPIAVVPILRAGLGMLEAIADLFPEVSVGYIGLERDERTAVANHYYCKLPNLEGKAVLLCDPMLATGGSACQAVRLLQDAGAASVRMLCVVAAPQGVERLLTDWPEVEIFTASLDEGLDERKYIVPGLGDFGDRLYGTM